MVEDHSQLLAHWAEKGIRDAVLINIDTHDDIRWIPEKKIDALRDIYKRNDRQKFREVDGFTDNSLYDIGNWIYAGARLGMFREVFWVIPYSALSDKDPELQIRQILRQYEFSEAEIHAFSLYDRQFRGSFHGIPLTICDIDSLPDISSPLLLSIDTDFFPPYSDVNKKSYLPALHAVFQALYSKKYQLLDAAVCYSVNSNYLAPHLRWLGDSIGMILEKPALINEQPTEMLSLLQQLDNGYRGTDAEQMFNLIENWQARYPVASLKAYKALAYTLLNDSDNACQAALDCCNTDKRYCTLLPYIGTYYYSIGRYTVAESFFQAGFAADPNMANGLFQYGHCLREMGRVKETIAWYLKGEAVAGPFPARFLIAEMQLQLRDRQAAMDSIAKADQSLMNNRYARVVSHEIARAVYAVLDFCDQEGFSDLSQTLHGSPAVLQMFAKYPREQTY